MICPESKKEAGKKFDWFMCKTVNAHHGNDDRDEKDENDNR